MKLSFAKVSNEKSKMFELIKKQSFLLFERYQRTIALRKKKLMMGQGVLAIKASGKDL